MYILDGCESRSLTMTKKQRRRVLDNRVLRNICGPKRGEVTGEWRRLHNEELDLYAWPNITRVTKLRMRYAVHVAHTGERIGAYRDLVGKPEGRRPLWRPRRRWKDKIKMDLQEVEWGGGMDWIDLAQDRCRWGLLWMRHRTFGCHKMRRISWLAEDLLASKEAVCPVELVTCVFCNIHIQRCPVRARTHAPI